METAAILQLIFLVSDLMVIAPMQYAKLKDAVNADTLTEQQINDLISVSEGKSDKLIGAIDDL